MGEGKNRIGSELSPEAVKAFQEHEKRADEARGEIDPKAKDAFDRYKRRSEKEPRVDYAKEFGGEEVRFEDILEELESAFTINLNRRDRLHTLDQSEREENMAELKLDGVSPETIQQVEKIAKGKIDLLNLLSRDGIERDFATSYVANFNKEELPRGRLSRKMRQVLYGENSDREAFWTFAPYVFNALKESGLEDKAAIVELFSWIENSEDPNEYDIGLKGLEFMNNEGSQPHVYVLDEDQKHVSHKFTYQQSKKIADMLLSEKQEEIAAK